jgi:hypothetical protein
MLKMAMVKIIAILFDIPAKILINTRILGKRRGVLLSGLTSVQIEYRDKNERNSQ